MCVWCISVCGHVCVCMNWCGVCVCFCVSVYVCIYLCVSVCMCVLLLFLRSFVSPSAPQSSPVDRTLGCISPQEDRVLIVCLLPPSSLKSHTYGRHKERCAVDTDLTWTGKYGPASHSLAVGDQRGRGAVRQRGGLGPTPSALRLLWGAAHLSRSSRLPGISLWSGWFTAWLGLLGGGALFFFAPQAV
jgi:hypothetical protein